MDSRVEKFLNQKKSSVDGLTKEWIELDLLYQNRLWHELTLCVAKFVKNEHLRTGSQLKELYYEFVSNFEHRINELVLVEIIIDILVAFEKPDEKLQFIRHIRDRVKSNALAVLSCDVVYTQVLLDAKRYSETKKCIDDLETKFDDLDHLTSVHSRFYDLASNYYRITGKHHEYYQNTLKFLGCIDVQSLPVRERAERAFNLGLAALLADDVYNFGEILQHPIMTILHNTREQWLVDLLTAFNTGNIEQFEKLKPLWKNQPDLAAAENVLHKKILLLCLMDMIFSAGTSRALSFNDVAQRTKLPKNQIELLAMRALSLGLIRGTIDQVDEILHMHWVKPRVLDLNQIQTLKKRLDQWTQDVKEMSNLVEQQAGDILV